MRSKNLGLLVFVLSIGFAAEAVVDLSPYKNKACAEVDQNDPSQCMRSHIVRHNGQELSSAACSQITGSLQGAKCLVETGFWDSTKPTSDRQAVERCENHSEAAVEICLLSSRYLDRARNVLDDLNREIRLAKSVAPERACLALHEGANSARSSLNRWRSNCSPPLDECHVSCSNAGKSVEGQSAYLVRVNSSKNKCRPFEGHKDEVEDGLVATDSAMVAASRCRSSVQRDALSNLPRLAANDVPIQQTHAQIARDGLSRPQDCRDPQFFQQNLQCLCQLTPNDPRCGGSSPEGIADGGQKKADVFQANPVSKKAKTNKPETQMTSSSGRSQSSAANEIARKSASTETSAQPKSPQAPLLGGNGRQDQPAQSSEARVAEQAKQPEASASFWGGSRAAVVMQMPGPKPQPSKMAVSRKLAKTNLPRIAVVRDSDIQAQFQNTSELFLQINTRFRSLLPTLAD